MKETSKVNERENAKLQNRICLEDFVDPQILRFLEFCAENVSVKKQRIIEANLHRKPPQLFDDGDNHTPHPFDVLGLERKCGIEAVKERKKLLTLLTHTDKNSHPLAGSAFSRVQEAYKRIEAAYRKRRNK